MASGASAVCLSVAAAKECGVLVQGGTETPALPAFEAPLLIVIGHHVPLQHAMQPVPCWHGIAARAGTADSVMSRMAVTILVM